MAGGSAQHPELDNGSLIALRNVADQTIGAGVTQKLTFDTTIRDTGIPGTWSTANNRFTPKVNGWYRVSLNGLSTSTGTAGHRFGLIGYINGSAERYIGGGTMSVTTDTQVHGTTMIYLTTADYFEFVFFTEDGMTLKGGSAANTLRAHIEYVGSN